MKTIIPSPTVVRRRILCKNRARIDINILNGYISEKSTRGSVIYRTFYDRRGRPGSGPSSDLHNARKMSLTRRFDSFQTIFVFVFFCFRQPYANAIIDGRIVPKKK